MTPRPIMMLCMSAALLVGAAPASAEKRMTQEQRIAALEARADNSQQNLDLLNQIGELKSEVQALRAQLEELQQQLEQSKGTQRSQYLDLDGRIGRLEAASNAPAVVDPATTTSATPAATAAPSIPVEPAPVVHGDVGGLAKTADERSAYDAAFAVLKSGKYADSARAFQQFLQNYPNGTYTPNALYWLGESYYVTQNYALALEQFQSLSKRYPTHDKAPGALLKIGLSQYGLKDFAAAERTLSAVAQQYPGTEAARTAEDRLRAIRAGGAR